MHHDEANQAVRFGQLLETGEYRYDRNDHHGPTLYYLTLPAAWARGQTTLASLDERTLRVVPALFGAGFILLLPLMARGLGRGAVAAAQLLAALSPALTYYSRFYIQESVLLFFVAGFLIALGRYAAGGGVRGGARGRRVRRAGAGDQGDGGAHPAGGAWRRVRPRARRWRVPATRRPGKPLRRGRGSVSLTSSAAWAWQRSSR